MEVYHALADGIGAFVFFRSLIQGYLTQKYGEAAGGPLKDENIPLDARQQDDFETNYSPENRRHGVHGARAYRIRGEMLPEHGLNFIVGRMPLGNVLAKAKEKGATLSEYLVAWLIFAVGQTMPLHKRKRPVVVSVPVDLRRFYASHTMRNFFATFGAAHCFDAGGGTFEEILRSVQNNFKDRLNPKALDGQMNQFASLEHNAVAKVTPLFIKTLILGISGLVTRGGDSAGFSNLGKVEMPKGAEKYIHGFDAMLSTTRPQLCVCSFGDTLSIGFSSPFVSTGVSCAFFRALAASGIHVGIYASMPGEVAL